MAKVRVKVSVRVRVKFNVAKYFSFDIMSRSQYMYVFSLFRKITSDDTKNSTEPDLNQRPRDI